MKKQNKERKSIVHLKVRELKELIESSLNSSDKNILGIEIEETLTKLNESIIELDVEDLRNLILSVNSSSTLQDNAPLSNKNEFKLITRTEMAKELKISLPTLRKWTVKKIIPNHIKLGGFVYYNKQLVIDFLKAKK